MEEVEKGWVGLTDALKNTFTNIGAGWEREILRREQAFEKEKQILLDRLKELEEKAARIDALTSENIQLREKLQSIHQNKPAWIVDLAEPHVVAVNRAATVDESTGEHNKSTEGRRDVIPYEEYQRVREKCEKALRDLELQKRQGGHYKVAFEKAREKCELYKKKLEDSKNAIKLWQDYADGASAAISATKIPTKETTRHTITPRAERSSKSKSPAHSTTSIDTPVLFPPSPTRWTSLAFGRPQISDFVPRLPPTQTIIPRSPERAENLGENEAYSVEIKTGAESLVNHTNITATGAEQPNNTTKLMVDSIPKDTVKQQVLPDIDGIDTAKGNYFPEVDKQIDINVKPSTEAVATVAIRVPATTLPSSQTTEGELESANVQALQYEHDDVEDEEPTIVSIRTVKRKRQSESRPYVSSAHVAFGTTMNGSCLKPYTIKREESYSSPLGLANTASLHQENSLDLDEVLGDIETPRKRRLRRRMFSTDLKNRKLDEAAYNRAASLPLESKIVQHRLSDSFEAAITENSARSQESVSHGCKDDSTADTAELPHSGEVTSKHQHSRDEGTKSPKHENGILQPTTVNKSVVPRANKLKARTLSKLRRQPAPIHEIAEDGERYTPTFSSYSCNTNLRVEEAKHSAKSVAGRIETLLHSSSPSRQFLAPRAVVNHLKPSSRSAITLNPESPRPHDKVQSLPKNIVFPDACTESRLEPIEHDSSKLRSGNIERTLGLSELDTYHPQPEDEPLRARSVQRLGLDDFKINPKFNQGLDFAFTEVVRNHEQRHCLPGCTRPECCGDRFRRIVELGGALPSPARGLWDSSPPDDTDDDDQRLLEAYLGHDQRQLKNLDTEQRHELLITAKAEQLAQRHGKHRQAFQRSGTPPGFWRTDMPSTQETKADREVARQMERRKVEERYLEAKKPNGRWLFRDEQNHVVVQLCQGGS